MRALVPLAAGEVVTYSYLAEEQLCAPYAERAALLQAAHHFAPPRSAPLEALETPPHVAEAEVAIAKQVKKLQKRREVYVEEFFGLDGCE